jgi:hypothetical protein
VHAHTRSIRSGVIAVLATAAIGLSAGTALGAHQISHTGSPGSWVLPDTAANPAAKCSYNGGGVMGGTYLTGIRLMNDVEIRGTTAGLRSVAFRPIIQHKVSGVWKTVKKGTLVSGNASLSSPVVLSGDLTSFGVTQQPKNPFRLALKLIWYRADASVQGTRTILVDSYVRRDGGVAGKCAGFVSNF